MYLPSHSPRYSKHHGSQAKSQLTRKREISHPFLQTVEERTLENTDLSASPFVSDEDHGTDPPMDGTQRTGR